MVTPEILTVASGEDIEDSIDAAAIDDGVFGSGSDDCDVARDVQVAGQCIVIIESVER
jgi:hypothetical protein